MIAITNLISFLKEGGTKAELAKDTGLSQNTVARWLNHWHKQTPKMVYISNWEAAKNGARVVRVFKWGSHSDRPQPKKTHKERSKEWRDRKRLDRCMFHEPARKVQ
jgi:hypothetical protein